MFTREHITYYAVAEKKFFAKQSFHKKRFKSATVGFQPRQGVPLPSNDNKMGQVRAQGKRNNQSAPASTFQ